MWITQQSRIHSLVADMSWMQHRSRSFITEKSFKNTSIKLNSGTLSLSYWKWCLLHHYVCWWSMIMNTVTNKDIQIKTLLDHRVTFLLVKSPQLWYAVYSISTYWRQKLLHLHCVPKKILHGFAGNFILFPAVKEFWRSVKTWESYCQKFGGFVFGTQWRRTVWSMSKLIIK